MLKSTLILLILLFVLSVSCTTISEEEKQYILQIDEWHKKRVDRLKEKDSWLSLAGLFWLEEGETLL